MQKLANWLVASVALSVLAALVIPPVEAQLTQPATVQQSITTSSQQTTVSSPPAPATVTTQTSSTSVTRTETAPALRPVVNSQTDEPVSASVVQYKKPKQKRHDWRTARRMAKYHWLDKAVEADPSLVESICNHYTAALILARHPRLGEIAQYDHYTCRRLTKWKTVARVLAKNGECAKVVALDPEGIYRAIKRDKLLAKLLATNPQFDQMIDENPDLGLLISQYM